MILYFHEKFFTLPDGRKKFYFKIKLSIANKIVIPHPRFPFDHRSDDRIYYQSFEPRWNSLSSVLSFLKKSSEYAMPKKDEYLWNNTGFWTIVNDDHDYLGVSLESLDRAIRIRKDGSLACCLANIDSIIIFSSLFKKGHLLESKLDIYVTNTYLPYVEVMQPFRDALKNLGKVSYLEEKFVDEEKVHKWFFKRRAYFGKPLALINSSKRQVPIIAVSNNPFHLMKNVEISPLDYFLGQMAGGFIESDFTGKKFFPAKLETWALQNVIVGSLLYHGI